MILSFWNDLKSLDFEGREADESESGADDPESDDDFRFMPAGEFEVVVEWSHFKESFFLPFKEEYLEDNGEGFDDEDTADNSEQEFFLDHERDDTDGGAECE